MIFEEQDIVINGEFFNSFNWIRRVSLNVSEDKIEPTRIFNRIITGPKNKKTSHQVAGKATVVFTKKARKLFKEVELDGKVYPLNSQLPEVRQISDFIKEEKHLESFLLKKDSIVENFLPIDGETLIEERKRLSKENFENHFGITVPPSYKFSPGAGLNYYPKNINMELPKIENHEKYSIYGIIMVAATPKIINTLKVLDGKIQDWKRYHYICIIEHDAYESMRGTYGCKVDVFRTKPKE